MNPIPPSQRGKCLYFNYKSRGRDHRGSFADLGMCFLKLEERGILVTNSLLRSKGKRWAG